MSSTSTFVRLILLSLVTLLPACSSTDSTTPCAPPAITTTESGLQYLDMSPGVGRRSDPGVSMTVHYDLWLADGALVDSSRDRPEPFTFILGSGAVIAGFDEGCTGLRVGGQSRITSS